ncbi:MAG: endo-1,4-beta-xylanase [Clostridiaceae bacterium]|nr:endo-1,4-beta-xylanase [Clostridiaceae bacterium]
MLIKHKKLRYKSSFSLIMSIIMILGIFSAVPVSAARPNANRLYMFTFTPAEKEVQESWFSPSSASEITWISGSGIGFNDDDYVLQGKHIGTDYTSANNAIRLILPEPLPAGQIYNIQVSFYVPSSYNQGKSTITGPGIVLNGGYNNSAYRLPSSAGTISMNTWKIVNVNTPRMTENIWSIDFRFDTNTAANHPDVWYIDNIVISRLAWDITIPSLADAYKENFLLGNIISPNQINTETTNMFKHHYNVVTAENHMKPSMISNAKGVYNFSSADSIISWAQQNDIKVHGHTLVWHSQSPNWLYRNPDNTPLTRSEARQNMQDYINNVAGHFAGKVISWDVVNEAFEGGSLPVTDWKAVTRKNSPWYLAYANGADTAKGESGADYIYDAFVFARLADPNAILVYNDYNETDAWKREAMVLMVEDLNAKWLNDPRNTDPERKLIERIGMQSHHFTQYPPVSFVEASIRRFIQAGVMIDVSELDIGYGSYNGPTNQTLNDKQQVEQAIYYARLFEIYKAYDAYITRVTFWGQADSLSWRSDYSPLVFDRAYAPKEAYYAVLDPSGYLMEKGIAPRSLHDLNITIDTNTITAGLPANITVKATAADLGNYNVIAYLDKDGKVCSDEFRLVNGTAQVVIPRAPEAGQYRIVVKAYSGSDLFAAKAVPVTIVDEPVEKDFTINATYEPAALTADKLFTAKVEVTRHKYEDSPVLLIVALYNKDNRMINVSYISKNFERGTPQTMAAGFRLPSDVEGHRVKFFVWDGSDMSDTSMTPLSDAITVQ